MVTLLPYTWIDRTSSILCIDLTNFQWFKNRCHNYVAHKTEKWIDILFFYVLVFSCQFKIQMQKIKNLKEKQPNRIDRPVSLALNSAKLPPQPDESGPAMCLGKCLGDFASRMPFVQHKHSWLSLDIRCHSRMVKESDWIAMFPASIPGDAVFELNYSLERNVGSCMKYAHYVCVAGHEGVLAWWKNRDEFLLASPLT